MDLERQVGLRADGQVALHDRRSMGRAIALMYGSKKILDGLRLWDAVAGHATPIFGVRVRDEATGATVTYDAGEIAGSERGDVDVEGCVLPAPHHEPEHGRRGIERT